MFSITTTTSLIPLTTAAAVALPTAEVVIAGIKI